MNPSAPIWMFPLAFVVLFVVMFIGMGMQNSDPYDGLNDKLIGAMTPVQIAMAIAAILIALAILTGCALFILAGM